MSQGTVTGTAFVASQTLEKTAFGELLTADLTPELAWRFDYSINPLNISTSGCANGGTVTTDQSRAKLSTSTNVAGISQIRTLKSLRYLPGVGGLIRFTCVFDTPKASSRQIIGVGDDVDGFFFGYNETTFGILMRRNSVDTWVSQASWTGSPLGETLVQTFGNIYQIRYQWLGYGLIRFYVFDKTVENFVCVHTIKYPNTSALTSILSPTLPLFAEIKNTGNNTNMVLYTPSALGAIEGKTGNGGPPLNIHRSQSRTITVADTANNHLFSLKNNSLAYTGPVVNRIPVLITSVILSRENNNVKGSTFYLYKTMTTAGVLTYTDVDTSHSPISTSNTSTTISTGTPIFQITLPAGITPFNILTNNTEIILMPGETLTISCSNSSVTSTDLSTTIFWEELF